MIKIKIGKNLFMKKKTKKILIVSGIVVTVLIGIGIFTRGDKTDVEYVTEKVKEGDVSKTISATGELVSQGEIDLNFEVTGRVKSVSMKVGDSIAQGEVIAVLDEVALTKEVQKAKLALDKAIADNSSNDDTVREAEQAVTNAESYLDEVDDLEDQKVAAAEEAYDNACDYYDDVESYYNKVVSEDGVDSSEAKYAKISLTSALNQKEAALQAWETAKKTEDLNVLTAQNSLETVKEDLDTAESNYAKSSRSATVETARKSYEVALNNLSKATLKAPITGVVTQINYKSGEVLSASTNFGKILSDDYILESDIAESDIAECKVGQKAEITFDALPSHEKFIAEIIEIEPAASVIQDVVYYKTKLRLDSVDTRLKVGMSADIDVNIASKENVLVAPERAINRINNHEEAKILLGDEVETVTVKTGLSGDDGLVEIISGLKDGDEVVTLEKNQ